MDALQSQLAGVKEAVAREQELSGKLRREAMAAASSAQRQLDLEREAKEATARQGDLVQRALEAEQRLASALRTVSASASGVLGELVVAEWWWCRPAALTPSLPPSHPCVHSHHPATCCCCCRRRQPPRRRCRRCGQDSLRRTLRPRR